MSDDPLKLGGLLDDEAIKEAVETRKRGKKAMDPTAAKNAETAAKREERLSTGAGPSKAPAPQAAPAPTPDVEDKSLLLDKIQAYRDRFPNLKSRNKLTGRSALEEIQDELHYCEQQLGQREGHMGTKLYMLALNGIEEVTTKHYNPLGLNLAGLSKVASENEDQFASIIDELFIKYATNMYIGPEMRLLAVTATLCYTVHSANSGNVNVQRAMEAASRPVKPAATDL